MKSSTIEAITVLIAETIAVMFMLFFGCMGGIPYGGTPNHLQAVLSSGFIIMSMIQTFGFISGKFVLNHSLYLPK